MGILALPIIGEIAKKGLGIIDKFIPDKDLARKLKHEFESSLSTMDYSYLETEIEKRAQVITAEAHGHSWLQRNWRPITMMVFVYIIAHNYIIAPIGKMFYPDMVYLIVPENVLPAELWALLKIGIGGYIVGRTGENMIKTWKKN